jgi:hypothetical protein
MDTGLSELDTNPLEDESLLSGVAEKTGTLELSEQEGSSGNEGDKVVHETTNIRQRISSNRDATPIEHQRASSDTSITIANLKDEKMTDHESLRQNSDLPDNKKTYVPVSCSWQLLRRESP